jgi:indolepyruvate ferredoxin oxidoreductase alpha subunit
LLFCAQDRSGFRAVPQRRPLSQRVAGGDSAIVYTKPKTLKLQVIRLDSPQNQQELSLLSGDEAVAMAAFDAGVKLGTGYPGTPSTEILETFETLGGRAQWSPNEKVALEVAIGVAFSGARALVTMKHVGLNVAADPLFTVAYTRLDGALVVVSADDPGMASSQNEQDNRRYALAAGVAMLEPSDSQEAYEFTLRAIEISERWQTPVLLRMTTRVCHSKTIVRRGTVAISAPHTPHFEHDFPSRVMIPAYARPAHRRLRKTLAQMAAWNDEAGPNQLIEGSSSLGIIASGSAFQYVREAAPEASVLKLGMTYPLPLERMRAFAESVDLCFVIEEGDPYLVEAARTAGIAVEAKPEMYRFGELNTARVRRILEGDESAEAKPVPGKPPALCPGCPHRSVYTALKNLNCIVPGDIGCYSLGVLPPFEAMDTLVCMGAGIGVGLGMRHSLPPEEAKRVVSVIGDSTFVHSGITGLVEMVYNPPASGHVVLILDNGTTAMTGMQEHPGTGRTLAHASTGKVIFEDLVRSLGVRNVHVIDPTQEPERFQQLIQSCLDTPELSVVIARRNCLLATRSIREYERCNERQTD